MIVLLEIAIIVISFHFSLTAIEICHLLQLPEVFSTA